MDWAYGLLSDCLCCIIYLYYHGLQHYVDITEGASAQFPTMISHFGSYGPSALGSKEKNVSIIDYYLLLGVDFSCFHKKKLQANPQVLESECKSRKNLRHVLLYLFCDLQYVFLLWGCDYTVVIYIDLVIRPVIYVLHSTFTQNKDNFEAAA